MKPLIVYFSWSNNTKTLVEGIQKELNYDVVRIEKKVPYSSDYNQCAYVEAKEEVEKHLLPEIKELNADVESYDEILLFFPIWWYTFPRPVGTFLKGLGDYKGKVVLFANSYTNDPQYRKNSLQDAKKANPSLKVYAGLFNKSLNEHIRYLTKGE